MKKLFASLLAATMVAGMAVSAFAAAAATDVMTDDEFSLYKTAYYDDNAVADNDDVFGGNSIYYPIVFLDEDNANAPTFATKASQIEGVKAKVKAKMGKEYVEKDANIVKVDPDDAGDNFANKVYCVEIKLNDYFKTVDSEVEVEVSLYEKGKKQMTTADDADAAKTPATVFTLGYEPEKLAYNTAATTVNTGKVEVKKTKDKDGSIELKINKDTKAVALKQYTNIADEKIDIEDITLLPGAGAPNFEYNVKASEQGALWLEVNDEADKEIVLANQDADVDFFNFPGTPEFDFNGTLKLFVEDTEKTYFCYAINDGKVTPVGKYNAEDECFEIKTNKLGSYVLADKELVNAKEDEKPADKPAEEKPADKVVGTGAIA